MDAAQAATKPKRCGFSTQALHLFTLLNLAFAARLYELLGRQPMFFVARKSEATDIVLFVLIVTVLLPGLVVLLQWLAGLASVRIRQGCHAMVVLLSITAITMPVLKPIDALPTASMMLAAVAAGALATAAYLRFAAGRAVVTILSPTVVLFPGLFLFGSPVLTLLSSAAGPPALDVQVGNPAPVVMVVFDEFCGTSLMDEHHQIDPVRYPNFAALAGDATWFRNATATSPSTHHVLPSLLTGGYPKGFREPPVASQFPRNLFTLLGKSHKLVVREGATDLCPGHLAPRDSASAGLLSRLRLLLIDAAVLELHCLFPEDGPVPLPDVTGRWGNFLNLDRDEGTRLNVHLRRGELFEEFVSCIRPSGKPGLYFAHVMLPHVPWTYVPSGREYPLPFAAEDYDRLYFTHGVVGLRRHSERWADDELAVTQAHQRYLLQVGFVDRLIGKLISHLKRVGLYDRSLIVITADHGVSFRPNDERRGMNDTNYPDIMSIPLLIKLPNQRQGAVSDRNVQSVDVLPTIAGVLQIGMPWTADGSSVFGSAEKEPFQKEITPDEDFDDRIAFEGAFEEKYETLQRMLAVFGSGRKPGGLFRIGPHNDLVGRRVEELGPTDTSPCTLEPAGPQRFANVDLDGHSLPCYIGGRLWLTPETPLPLDLAIAVNGTIRAVTRTFQVKGLDNAWAAMVSEEAFQRGENIVQVFVVSSIGKQLRLSEAIPAVSHAKE